jgi:hypothetical protein
VKVLLAQVVKGSVHPALEQGEESFNGVGVDVLPALFANVFLLAVVHGIVRSHMPFEYERIYSGVIGHHLRPAVNVFLDNRLEVCRSDVRHMERPRFAVALHQGHHGSLVVSPGLHAVALHLAADIGFVNFDGTLKFLAGQRLHGVPDSVSHEPSALVGDPAHPMDLV